MAMLDSTHLQAPFEIDDQTLDLFRYYEILKKRKFYGLIPLVGVFAIGFAVAMLWPPTFLSEGKILVQSQQIPVDLVRPTVTATASERLATIEQRVMTRENLLKQATNLKGFHPSLFLDGITLSVTPTDRTPWRQARMARFSGTSWEPFGDIVTIEDDKGAKQN